MARFSNKIESLKYADRQHKSIEILYKNGEEIYPYYIEVDYNNQDFLDLLEEYSIEDVEDQTKYLMAFKKYLKFRAIVSTPTVVVCLGPESQC